MKPQRNKREEEEQVEAKFEEEREQEEEQTLLAAPRGGAGVVERLGGFNENINNNTPRPLSLLLPCQSVTPSHGDYDPGDSVFVVCFLSLNNHSFSIYKANTNNTNNYLFISLSLSFAFSLYFFHLSAHSLSLLLVPRSFLCPNLPPLSHIPTVYFSSLNLMQSI